MEKKNTSPCTIYFALHRSVSKFAAVLRAGFKERSIIADKKVKL